MMDYIPQGNEDGNKYRLALDRLCSSRHSQILELVSPSQEKGLTVCGGGGSSYSSVIHTPVSRHHHHHPDCLTVCGGGGGGSSYSSVIHTLVSRHHHHHPDCLTVCVAAAAAATAVSSTL
ncbi:hypothetical protein RRG08_008505 [Elysia crispata]|uniref:Uncharacterized protein n=1 Tax=Elysia crispata TaxID=231223 RepID=A0AAE0Z8A1_9GAST|nr:hypothetical protein RRG08_008505 [Elysia crispata]